MSATMTREQSRAINEALFEKLASRDPGLEKEAADAVNAFTRLKMREDGFFRKIMPPVTMVCTWPTSPKSVATGSELVMTWTRFSASSRATA